MIEGLVEGLRSKCHGAKVKILFTTIDWYTDKTITENNYECQKCHALCGVEDESGKQK